MTSITSKSSRKIGMLVSYIYSFVSIVVSLVYVPLLLNGIGEEEYGLYQLVGSVMSYIVSINGVLSAGVGRFYCMYRAEGESNEAQNVLGIAKRLYVVISIIVMVSIFVLAFVAKFIYQSSLAAVQLDELFFMILVLGINTIITMFNSISIAVITAFERFVFLKVSSLLSLLAQPIIVALLLPVAPNAIMVTFVVLATNLACALVQCAYTKFVLKIRSAYLEWNLGLVKGLFRFSGSLLLVAIADQIFWKTDQLIVGYLYGAAAVAIYSIGSQIYSAYMALGTAASSVFLPRVSELYHRNKDMKAISELFSKVGKISFLILGVVLSAFLVLGPDFIELWAGPGYFDSYLVAAIVMVPFTIDLIQAVGLTILQVINKYLFRGVMYLIVAVVNVFLTLLFLQIWGIPGAAISTALAMLLGNGFIMNWYYWKVVGLDIPYFWRSVSRPMLPALFLTIAFGVFYWTIPMEHGSWATFLFAGLLFVVLYFLFEYLFGLNAIEKRALRATLRRRQAK